MMSEYLDRFQSMLNSSSREEEPKDRDSNVLIIDGLNSWIRVWQAIPVLSSSGEHIGGISGFLKSIGTCIRQYNPTRCIVVFDGQGGSLRRRRIFPEYKSNRTPNLRQCKKEFSSLEEEQASMKIQFQRMREYLEHLPLSVVCIDHIEADDSIASIVGDYYDSQTNITIVSTDRDFLQLITEYVHVWNPVRKVHYHPKQIKEEYGILSENYLLYRVLTGDTSDAIPGISGLGLKTLLKEYPFDTTVLDIDTFLKLTEEKTKKPKKFVNEILSNTDRIHLNHQLMQLKNIDISLHSKNQIRDILDMEIPKSNRIEFLKKAYLDKINDNWNIESWLPNTFDLLDRYR